jgi:hypothetical protein
MHKLYELKKTLCAELEEYAKRGNNLDLQSLETIDILAHAVKNLDKVIKAEDEELGYSGRSYANNSYNSYEGGWSNMRSRMSNARDRYSYTDTMESFKKLIDSAPDEQTRVELSRMMQKFE